MLLNIKNNKSRANMYSEQKALLAEVSMLYGFCIERTERIIASISDSDFLKNAFIEINNELLISARKSGSNVRERPADHTQTQD